MMLKFEHMISAINNAAKLLVACVITINYPAALHAGESYSSAKSSEIKCGSSRITIISHCVYSYENTAKCSEQDIIFSDKNGIRMSFTNLKYKDDSMIVSEGCINLVGGIFVVFESTNFGNCAACEWIDVFSVDGKYTGSTRSKFGSVNFKYKKLRTETKTEIDSAIKQSGYSQSAHIDRVFRKGSE